MPTLPVNRRPSEELPVVQRIVSVMWPSFVTAAASTIVFFALFDPSDLARLLGFPELSAFAAYTAGFFGFWLSTSISSTLSGYFSQPTYRANSNGSLDRE